MKPLSLSPDAVNWIKTISDAAVAGSQISREAFEVISLLMCGWTLHAAKHKAYSESKGAK